MAETKKGVLLVNLGTPKSTSVKDVRVYLREFLLDGRVIDISAIGRWMLINLIIAPFRAPKSAKVYRELWQDRGSPLMFHTMDLAHKVRVMLPKNYVVEVAMRYQIPSIKEGLEKLKEANVEEIIILPLFPQYASATTGSVHEKVMDIVSKWQVIPQIKFISKFFDHPQFIKAFSRLGKHYLEQKKYDHVIFSYHGLPERQIHKAAVKGYCQLSDSCCGSYNTNNKYCYRAQCFATTRMIAKELGLGTDDYSIAFQSRLGKTPWVQPYAEDVIKKLAAEGKKSILIYSPAFVADCLETTIEVGEEFKEMFIEAGGEQWQLVESLNSNDDWVECVADMITTI